MSVHNARKLRDGLLIGGLVVMLMAYNWEPMFIVGTVVAFSSLIPHFLWNRCPHCERQLGRNNGDYCQFCGSRLDEE